MIKVGYLVSYDYEFLLTSIVQLYESVDRIFLAIDKDRKTWGGNSFEIPQSFFDQIKLFDSKNKIEFYFDVFFIEGLSPMENEVRERNMLSRKMGKGWLIQLDVDEYIYNFDLLAKYLKKHIYLTFFPFLTPIVFRGRLITVFKKVDEGYLYIDNGEKFSFITNFPEYNYGRSNNNIINHLLDTITIHQSWARNEDEIQLKINNWGHRDDFDTLDYFKFWKSLTKQNYNEFKNFHPLYPAAWDEMRFLKSENMTDFIDNYSSLNSQRLIPLHLFSFFKKTTKKILKKIIFKWRK